MKLLGLLEVVVVVLLALFALMLITGYGARLYVWMVERLGGK